MYVTEWCQVVEGSVLCLAGLHYKKGKFSLVRNVNVAECRDMLPVSIGTQKHNRSMIQTVQDLEEILKFPWNPPFKDNHYQKISLIGINQTLQSRQKSIHV